jgi:hypothetical protein
MNHINLDKDFVKGLIEEANWAKIGLSPLEQEAEVVEEAAAEVEAEKTEEVNEELTLEDLEALLSAFPDSVLEEHVLSVAEVLNEVQEQSGDVVEEDAEEDEDAAASAEVVTSIVDKVLGQLEAPDSEEE